MNMISNPAPKNASVAHIALGLIVIYLCWGGTYVGIKLATDTIPPFLMAGMRFFIAGVIMYAWIILRGRKKATAVQWLRAGLLGILMPFIGNGGIVWAEQMIPSGVAALLVGTVPLWMVILNWLWFDRERPTLLVSVGLVIGFSGVYVLLGLGEIFRSDPIHLLGIIILLIASLSWAVGSLYSRRPGFPESPFETSAIEMIVGGAAFFTASIFAGEPVGFHLQAVNAVSIWSLLYLITFGSILGFTVYAWLLKSTSPTLVSTYAFVNPIVAIILGSMILAEPFNARILIAAAMIVPAVVIITFSYKKQKAERTDSGENV